MKKIKESEIRVIKRSQINLNPCNPKNHTDEKIKFQKQNFQKIGFLGGIVWNEKSGNLIDGHRRVMAMDLHYKYNGTPETDYEVRIEVVNFDEKTEKEQLTYMALGNTKAEMNLIANYAEDIDLSNIGISDIEISEIRSFMDVNLDIESFDVSDFSPVKQKTEEEKQAAKEQIKAVKNNVLKESSTRNNNESAYLTVSFSTMENKQAFCELLGYEHDSKFVKGEEILNLID